MISRLSQMMRPHFLLSSYMACLPPPILIRARSHLPFVVASAAAISWLHSSSFITLSNTTAHASSFSGMPSWRKLISRLSIFGAGLERKSAGNWYVDAMVSASISTRIKQVNIRGSLSTTYEVSKIDVFHTRPLTHRLLCSEQCWNCGTVALRYCCLTDYRWSPKNHT